MRSVHTSLNILVFGALLLLVGCRGAVVEERPFGASVADPVTRAWHEPARSAEQGPTNEEQRKQLADTNRLLDDFITRADVAFTSEEARQHLPGLERFFLATGRYLELVQLYRDAWDRHGPSHYIAPWLAWAYLTLGDDARAADVLDAALLARPDDAFVQFAEGYLIGMNATNDVEVGKEIYRRWSLTIQLDPAFVGPQGITAARIKARLDEMGKMLQRQGVDVAALTKSPAPPRQPDPALQPPGSAPEAPGSAPEAPGSTPTPPGSTPTPPGSASSPTPVVDPRLVQAEALLAEGKALDAGRLFDAVLKDDPTSNRADVGRALSAWRADKIDRVEAEKLIRHVIQRPDLSARQCYELGSLMLRDLKDRDAALALWRRALQLDPEFARSVRLEATIERVSGAP